MGKNILIQHKFYAVVLTHTSAKTILALTDPCYIILYAFYQSPLGPTKLHIIMGRSTGGDDCHPP